jgi:hypothetical protein
MQAQSKQVGDDFCSRIERLVVLQVLDWQEPRSRDALDAALSDIDPLAIEDALRALSGQDVLYVYREQVYPHRSLLHLNDLSLIAV